MTISQDTICLVCQNICAISSLEKQRSPALPLSETEVRTAQLTGIFRTLGVNNDTCLRVDVFKKIVFESSEDGRKQQRESVTD